jgi:hypothetical protein
MLRTADQHDVASLEYSRDGLVTTPKLDHTNAV